MTVTVTDLFCGAGGSSSGAVSVPGVAVQMALNHWQLAIDTHNTNHPQTDHACADVSQVNPRRFRRTDILWASPECVNHSQAQGRKRLDATPDLFGEVLPDEAAERSRATMWDVCRFAEIHRYRAIIVENVPDVAKWVMFDAWLMAMTAMGYEHHIVYLNSMHAAAAGDPAPQSRDRIYVVFWLAGNRRPDFDKWTRPQAWCPTCENTVTAVQAWKKPLRWGRYRQQYVWRCPQVSCRNRVVEPAWLPASTAIDWALKGQRIGDRPLREFTDRKTGEVTVGPLAPKTMARIEAGLARFADTSPDPFLTLFRSDRDRNFQTTETLATIVADGSNHGLVVPMLVPAGGTWNEDATPVTDVMRTRTTRDSEALLVPVEGRVGNQPRPVARVMRTMTTRNETGLLVPYNRTGVARGAEHPHRTFTTHDNCGVLTSEHLHGRRTDPPGSALAVKVPRIEDCEFRMLEPYETKLGMAFQPSYVIHGNRREQQRQAGNAVTPPAARDLVAAVVETFHDVVIAA